MLTNITKRFGERVVLGAISYHFPEGERIALIGANGAGKSTLLNIICGLEQADDGNIIRPKDCVLGYLPQEPNPTPKPTIWDECLDGASRLQALIQQRQSVAEQMATSADPAILETYQNIEDVFQALGGYELDGLAHKILTGLGFAEAQWQEDPQRLSGGWRMRLELARVLVNQPDFLILDEPTNHLDLPSLQWLESYLLTYRGTIVFVSHDHDLLNRLATITLYLNHGKVISYKGNLNQFMDYKELVESQNKSQLKHLEQRSAEIERFIERFRAKPTKARQVASRVKMLARLRDIEGSIPQERPLAEVVMRFDPGTPSGKVVVKSTDADIGYDKPLLRKLNLRINRGDRIAIVGANGRGKTTFLKATVGQLPILAGELTLGNNVRVGYFSQDLSDILHPKRTLLAQVMHIAPQLSEREARSLLGAFLFTQDDGLKHVGVLSGGERSRLGFCCLIANKPNFLVLDEPTNHLDMTSAAVLADALAEYEGTVIFVSHNRQFIRQVATVVWELTPRQGLEPLTIDI
jgi:ATP-binding cassette subfamily F protein 3